MSIQSDKEFDAYTSAIMNALHDFHKIIGNISKAMGASEDDFIKVTAALGQSLLFSTIKSFALQDEYTAFLDEVFRALKRQAENFKLQNYTVQ
jgi:hypothetical protein